MGAREGSGPRKCERLGQSTGTDARPSGLRDQNYKSFLHFDTLRLATPEAQLGQVAIAAMMLRGTPASPALRL